MVRSFHLAYYDVNRYYIVKFSVYTDLYLIESAQGTQCLIGFPYPFSTESLSGNSTYTRPDHIVTDGCRTFNCHVPKSTYTAFVNNKTDIDRMSVQIDKRF